MNELIVKILESIKSQDAAKLVVTLDMLLSGAAFIEKLIITMSKEMSDEEVQKEIEASDKRYIEQKARMKDNIAKAKLSKQ